MNDENTKEGETTTGAASALSAWLAVTPDELRTICDATVRLTEIRQRGCAHLCVENVAPEIMLKLLLTLRFHKEGLVNSSDIWGSGLDEDPTANAKVSSDDEKP